MAAPKKNTSKPDDIRQAKTRAAIQTTQLINRLQNFALGMEGVEIDAGRIKAIEILLRKSLPDLQSVQMDVGGGITIQLGEHVNRT